MRLWLRREAEAALTRAAYHAVRRWCAAFPLERRRLPPGTRAVSFSFDDFPASSVDCGATLLERYGVRGTFYACLSKCGEGRPFQVHHLHRLRQTGHELGCHSHGHENGLVSSDQAIEASIALNARELERVSGFGFAPHYAFPYGLFRPSARRLLAPHFRSLRTIHPGVHRTEVDLLALKSSPLLRDTPAQAVDLELRQVAEEGGWLIFYTHEVEARPSPYGTTPASLERVLERCQSLGLEVLPVGEMVSRIY